MVVWPLLALSMALETGGRRTAPTKVEGGWWWVMGGVGFFYFR